MRPDPRPKLARLILRLFLRGDTREFIVGDIDEEYFEHVLPERDLRAARRWYWSNSLRTVAKCLLHKNVARIPRQRDGGDFMLSTVWLDVRHFCCMLAKNPGFALVAVLTLALGIGANAAIFSVVNTVLLKPLPFDQPERLVQVFETRPEAGSDGAPLSRPNFRDYREQTEVFHDLGGLVTTSGILTGEGFPEQLTVGRVSAGFWGVLGVRPLLGRTFALGEDEPESESRLAILSMHLWSSRFGSDSSLVGETILLNGATYTVVGVLPGGPVWLNAADLFVPLVRNPAANRNDQRLQVVGRLTPGATLQTARADLEAIAFRIAEAHPELQGRGRIGIRLDPSSTWIADADTRRALWVLTGTVGILLLIACVNLANLLLARGIERKREMALRSALGAGRARIVRQLFTESMVLAFLGAGAGVALGFGLVQLTKTLDPGRIPRLSEVTLDSHVLGFALVVAVLVAIVSSLAPALLVGPSGPASALKAGHRASGADQSRTRTRSFLVGTEVALSLILLIGAGLLVRSFAELSRVDRGFQSDNRLFFSVGVPPSMRADDSQTGDFIEQFCDRLEAAPQVLAAAAVSSRVMSRASTGMPIGRVGELQGEADGTPWARWRLVSQNYFQALGLRLVSGRAFDVHDRIGAPWRVVISRRLAETLWPGESPVGRQSLLWKGQDDYVAEVIGVVEDMRERGLERDPTLAVYLPFYGAGWPTVDFLIHTSVNPAGVAGALRSYLTEIDPNLPLFNIQSMDEIVSGSVAARRFNMVLLCGFACVAFLMALAGVYGVQSYSVATRTGELGIRMALGANHSKVIRRVVVQGMFPVLIGGGVGLAGAFGLSRFLSSLLFGVRTIDPVTYLLVGLVIGSTALASCYLPARRTVSIDPIIALRE